MTVRNANANEVLLINAIAAAICDTMADHGSTDPLALKDWKSCTEEERRQWCVLAVEWINNSQVGSAVLEHMRTIDKVMQKMQRISQGRKR